MVLKHRFDKHKDMYSLQKLYTYTCIPIPDLISHKESMHVYLEEYQTEIQVSGTDPEILERGTKKPKSFLLFALIF